jgi:hypothetical protein
MLKYETAPATRTRAGRPCVTVIVWVQGGGVGAQAFEEFRRDHNSIFKGFDKLKKEN